MSEPSFKEIFTTNLRNLLSETQTTQADLAKYLGCSPSTVSDWVNGRKYPRMSKVDAICARFGITRNDLLMEHTPEFELDRKRKRMYMKLEKAPPEVLDKIDQMIDIMVQRDIESG